MLYLVELKDDLTASSAFGSYTLEKLLFKK
jgi:hypothetical protein